MSLELFMSCIHPEDRDMVASEWQAALKGEPYDIGHRIIVDGEVLWVQEKADLTYDDAGKLAGGIGTVQDVTAQHVAAVQLTELLEFNEKVIAESPVGIAVYRADGPCVLANEALARIVGGDLETVRNHNFRRLPVWRTLGLLDTAMEALQSDQQARCVAKGQSSFGKSIAIDCEFTCINRHGEKHLLLLAYDTSEFHAAEKAMREAMNFAEEANRAKSEFLANMSHEIRTPMNAVMGLAQLALDEARDPRLIDHLRQMYRSASLLLGIINDILDYSKIEAGRVQLEQRDFNTHDLVATLSGMFRVPTQEKSVTLNIHLAPNVPHRVIGDTLRINQVLINLVGNAVKFTERGAISVDITRAGESDAIPVTDLCRARLRFAVSDTGIGMDNSALARLFQPFVQADGSITRRYGGTGLGLSISRRLVQMMGGDIEVESTLGQGSTFHFELDFTVPMSAQSGGHPGEHPAEHPTATNDPPTINALADTAQAIAGSHVLLVEDDGVNQRVARSLLERAGLKVTVAGNGQEALDSMEHNKFDAVLMDLQMPVMSGLEATERIRADTRWQALPVIAVSASVLAQDRELCAKAGITDYVMKPVQPTEMIGALLRHIKRRSPSTADNSTGSAVWPAATLIPAPTLAPGDAAVLRSDLQTLLTRVLDNEFIAVTELAELHALFAPLADQVGESVTHLEAAISRYEYTTARSLLDELLRLVESVPVTLPDPTGTAEGKHF